MWQQDIKVKNSVFKPLLPVGDSTAIRRIIITLKRAGVSPIVVVTGDKADELENIFPISR